MVNYYVPVWRPGLQRFSSNSIMVAINLDTEQYYKPHFDVAHGLIEFRVEENNTVVVELATYRPFKFFSRFNFIKVSFPPSKSEKLIMTEKNDELNRHDERPGYQITRMFLDAIMKTSSLADSVVQFMNTHDPSELVKKLKIVNRRRRLLEGSGKTHAENYQLMYEDPNVYRNRIGKDLYYMSIGNGLGIVWKVGEKPKFVTNKPMISSLDVDYMYCNSGFLELSVEIGETFQSQAYFDLPHSENSLIPFGCTIEGGSNGSFIVSPPVCKFSNTCKVPLLNLFDLKYYPPIDGKCPDEPINPIQDFKVRW